MGDIERYQNQVNLSSQLQLILAPKSATVVFSKKLIIWSLIGPHTECIGQFFVMSPFAAKRLSVLLNQVLKDYETRYGTLDVAVTQAAPGSSVQ